MMRAGITDFLRYNEVGGSQEMTHNVTSGFLSKLDECE